MRCERNEESLSCQPMWEGAEETDSVSGLAEWMALQAWRANWQPELDPARSVEELATVLRRAVRAGYTAFWTGVKAMPTLFFLDRTLACMWQEGYASAGREAVLGMRSPLVRRSV